MIVTRAMLVSHPNEALGANLLPYGKARVTNVACKTPFTVLKGLLHRLRRSVSIDRDSEHDMRTLLKRFGGDESGATAIEYGMIAALIAVVIIAAIKGIGTKLNTKFTAISGNLN